MMLSAKSMSSPGRPEKFPPPLMRFLRSNVGSKSRGRSRSSPMFVRKKNTAIETQEPSSPKVTCMGQVRVRRSKKSASGKTGARKRRSRFQCIRNALFCRRFSRKGKFRMFRILKPWRKCGLPFGWCSIRNRKPKIRSNSSRIESKFGSEIGGSVREEAEIEMEEEEEESSSKVFASSSSSPPKNALLLTRCRSAPYRSSSLAGRFWGSPLEDSKPEPDPETEELKLEPENKEPDNPTSERESTSRDSDQESRTDPETEEKTAENATKFEESKPEEQLDGLAAVGPLILTRCKSEPAKIAAKLDPEMIFWKKKRLGFTY